jgi:hypothetical protein
LRWDEACVRSCDGIAADRQRAVAIAKAGDREMQAVSGSRTTLSADADALSGSRQHYDDDIERGHPDSCLARSR